MLHTELTHYIEKAHLRGLSDEEITQKLLGTGWKLSDIMEALLGHQLYHAPHASHENIISVRNVSKHYGEVRALNDISLDVKRGGVTALLGPNGAGKTTLVRTLSTLLTPDAGSVQIAGLDLVRDAKQLRSMIGLTGQYAAVDEILTARENLELVGRLYHLPKEEVRKRSEELLVKFDLVEAADRPLKTYSGGMRRRLDLAASLIAKPTILFLDEPTTGLDPKSRFDLWNVIRDLVSEGTTVLLTTQYLEEADQLANYIFVIDHGRIIAEGTADSLKKEAGGDILEIHVAEHGDAPRALDIIKHLGEGEAHADTATGIITMPVAGAKVLIDVVRALDGQNLSLSDIRLRRPSLDDVFMKLTGHEAQ